MRTPNPIYQFSSCIPHSASAVPEEQTELDHRHVSFNRGGPPEVLCHSRKSSPKQRKTRRSQRSAGHASIAWPSSFRVWSDLNVTLMVVIFVFALLLDGASAQERYHPALQKLARRGELLFDRSPRPEVPVRPLLVERDAKLSSSSVVPSATPVLVSTTGLGGGSIALATAAPSSSSLPQPFDTSIGSNFTTGSGCPAFFSNFLNNALFQSCYPFSLLLQVSLYSPL
jgi:hypothetical protein